MARQRGRRSGCAPDHAALAQAPPPVTIVVPCPPGGSIDVTAPPLLCPCPGAPPPANPARWIVVARRRPPTRRAGYARCDRRPQAVAITWFGPLLPARTAVVPMRAGDCEARLLAKGRRRMASTPEEFTRESERRGPVPRRMELQP